MKAHPLSLALALATGLLLQASPASADTLLVDRVRDRKHAPVAGPNSRQHNPPITRWDYAGFSVYFEYNHVVDAVAAKSRPEEIGPKPIQ